MGPTFLTSTLNWGERSAPRPVSSNLSERAPDTHWIGGCVERSSGLEVVEIFSYLYQESHPDFSVVQSVT